MQHTFLNLTGSSRHKRMNAFKQGPVTLTKGSKGYCSKDNKSVAFSANMKMFHFRKDQYRFV